MTRRKKKQLQKKFLLISVTLFVFLFSYLVVTEQVRITLAKDLTESEAVPANYQKVTTAGLYTSETILTSEKDVVILFTSSWCGSCDVLIREAQKKAISNPNVKFLELNLDTYRDLANDLDVKFAPSAVFVSKDEYRSFNGIGLEKFSTNTDFLTANLFTSIK